MATTRNEALKSSLNSMKQDMITAMDICQLEETYHQKEQMKQPAESTVKRVIVN